MHLPRYFCWSKFGVESGEQEDSILARKERERRGAGGVFLWGIGNSIRPSLIELLRVEEDPIVVFSPMLSQPKPEDVRPARVVQWTTATGLDGNRFVLPPTARVTSRGSARRSHFALVCRRDEPLSSGNGEVRFSSDRLRNLRTGSRLGASQVTSVVEQVDNLAANGGPYEVAFSARLVAPFLLFLGDPISEPPVEGVGFEPRADATGSSVSGG